MMRQFIERFLRLWPAIARFILIALFALPLIKTDFTLFPALYGRTVFFMLGVALIFLGTLLFLALGGELRLPRSPLLLAIAAYIIARLVSGFLGENAGKSFWGDQMRMTGTILWVHLGIFAVLISTFFSRENIRRLIVWAAAFGAGTAALAWFMRLTNLFPEPGITGRLFGTFGNPIFLANFLVIQVFLALMLVADARGPRKFTPTPKVLVWGFIWAGVAALDTVTLFFTESRGAFLAMMAGSAIFLFGAAFFGRERKVRYAAFGGTALFVGVLALLFVFRSSPFLAHVGAVSRLVGSGLAQFQSATRFIFWEIAWKGFSARPLLGWGPENFDIVFDRFYNPQLAHFSFYETWADRPHNTILEVMATSGIIGVLSYAAVFITAAILLLRALWRRSLPLTSGLAVLGALAAYAVAGAFSFETPGALMLLFLLFAWVITVTAAKEKQRAVHFVLDPALRIVSAVTLTISFTLTVIFFGIRPLRASNAAAVSGNALNSGAANRYEKSFGDALRLPAPYRDEILIIIADDLLKADARGLVSHDVLVSVLPRLVAAMESASGGENPNRFALVYRLGQMQGLAAEYVDRKYTTPAERSFDAADALSPGRQVVAMARAQVLLATDNAPRAEETLRELLATDPEFAKAHWLLGLILLGKGDTQAGREELYTALKKGVGLSSVREKLLAIDVYTEAQEFEPIVSFYHDLISLQPKNPDWHARLAATYASLGKKKEALNEVTRAVELDPSFREDAEKFLKIIDVLPD